MPISIRNSIITGLGYAGTGICASAKIYKGTIDTVGVVGKASIECAQSAISVVGNTCQRGIKETAKDIGKACIGLNDLKKAKRDFNTTEVVVQVNGNVTGIRNRTFSERTGAGIGHVVDAAGKAALSVGALAIVSMHSVGTAYNIVGVVSEDSLMATIQGAAGGYNQLAKAIAGPAANLAVRTAKVAASSFQYLVCNAPQIAATAGPVLAAGALLYAAATEVGNTAGATNRFVKVLHGTAAVGLAALATACAVYPRM